MNLGLEKDGEKICSRFCMVNGYGSRICMVDILLVKSYGRNVSCRLYNIEANPMFPIQRP